MIPTGEATIPYFWVETDDAADVEAALRESTLVAEAQVLDELDDETLFRVEWTDDVNGFIRTIGRSDVVVLDGRGHGDVWWFQLRFPDNDALAAFYRRCADDEVVVDVESVQSVESTRTPELGLTTEQREALKVALDEGYFDVPREITLVELADMLGISDSAVSQRIRRGLAELLTTTVVPRSSDR
ncbi:MAG: helix-turn-helix domain-containing protein [Haloferacaceae archaeon]